MTSQTQVTAFQVLFLAPIFLELIEIQNDEETKEMNSGCSPAPLQCQEATVLTFWAIALPVLTVPLHSNAQSQQGNVSSSLSCTMQQSPDLSCLGQKLFQNSGKSFFWFNLVFSDYIPISRLGMGSNNNCHL